MFLLRSYCVLTVFLLDEAAFSKSVISPMYDWNQPILIGCFGQRKLLPRSAFPDLCPAALYIKYKV